METNEQLETLNGTKIFLKGLSEDCRKNLMEAMKIDANETKERICFDIQQKILDRAKTKGQKHHYGCLKKRTDVLITNKDEKGLKSLYEKIDFTEKQGLMFKTPEGRVKFAPKQATYDDIKDIKGIKKNKNIWTKNPASGQKGLWVNFEAVEYMNLVGKKIFEPLQFFYAAEIFLGESNVEMKNFFDLLGVEHFGNFNGYSKGGQTLRFLWSNARVSRTDGRFFHEQSREVCRYPVNYALGIWFLED